MRHRYSNGAVVVMTVLLLAAVVVFALLSLRNEPSVAGGPAVAGAVVSPGFGWPAEDRAQ